MYYVSLFYSGFVSVSDVEPLADDSEIDFTVTCSDLGHAYAVQAIAIRAKNRAFGNDIQVREMKQEASMLRDTIETQARIIRDNNMRVEFLESEMAKERAKTHDREIVLHNVMGALALDMALERTHQQRNAAMRAVVRLIKRILDNADIDMDDIPF